MKFDVVFTLMMQLQCLQGLSLFHSSLFLRFRGLIKFFTEQTRTIDEFVRHLRISWKSTYLGSNRHFVSQTTDNLFLRRQSNKYVQTFLQFYHGEVLTTDIYNNHCYFNRCGFMSWLTIRRSSINLMNLIKIMWIIKKAPNSCTYSHSYMGYTLQGRQLTLNLPPISSSNMFWLCIRNMQTSARCSSNKWKK